MTSPVNSLSTVKMPSNQDSFSFNLLPPSEEESLSAQTNHRSVKKALSYVYNTLKDFFDCINPVSICNRKVREWRATHEDKSFVLMGLNKEQQLIVENENLDVNEAEEIDETSYDFITKEDIKAAKEAEEVDKTRAIDQDYVLINMEDGMLSELDKESYDIPTKKDYPPSTPGRFLVYGMRNIPPNEELPYYKPPSRSSSSSSGSDLEGLRDALVLPQTSNYLSSGNTWVTFGMFS